MKTCQLCKRDMIPCARNTEIDQLFLCPTAVTLPEGISYMKNRKRSHLLESNSFNEITQKIIVMPYLITLKAHYNTTTIEEFRNMYSAEETEKNNSRTHHFEIILQLNELISISDSDKLIDKIKTLLLFS